MTMLPFFGYRLRCDNVLEPWFDLQGGDARSIPTTAEGFDEENAGDEFLTANDGHLLLVVEQILLGVDDVEIADETAGVAAFGDGKGAARGVDGVLLRVLGFVQT